MGVDLPSTLDRSQIRGYTVVTVDPSPVHALSWSFYRQLGSAQFPSSTLIGVYNDNNLIYGSTKLLLLIELYYYNY